MFHLDLGICGAVAGAVNGLLGAGGGMILVPLLNKLGKLGEKQVFPSSVAIILPLCCVSLAISGTANSLPWKAALPYLLGAIPGGLLAGILGRRIQVNWLHKALGVMILWGGFRYLW